MIEGYLASGRDVVLPQLLIDPAEIALFEEHATRAGAEFVERVLMDSVERSVARFHRRGDADPADAWHPQVRRIVADQGGDVLLRDRHHALEALAASRPGVVVVESTAGDVAGTYERLLATLG